MVLFFFKQKTANEMRISDWSSDVCSSDLQPHHQRLQPDQAVLKAKELRKDRQHEQVGLGIEQAGQHALAESRRTGALPSVWLQVAERGEIGRASWRERVCQYV